MKRKGARILIPKPLLLARPKIKLFYSVKQLKFS